MVQKNPALYKPQAPIGARKIPVIFNDLAESLIQVYKVPGLQQKHDQELNQTVTSTGETRQESEVLAVSSEDKSRQKSPKTRRLQIVNNEFEDFFNTLLSSVEGQKKERRGKGGNRAFIITTIRRMEESN
jgi:hypothetical protein